MQNILASKDLKHLNVRDKALLLEHSRHPTTLPFSTRVTSSVEPLLNFALNLLNYPQFLSQKVLSTDFPRNDFQPKLISRIF